MKSLPEPFFQTGPDPARPPYPADAVNLTELASRLTGNPAREADSITQVFPPPAFLTPEEFASLSEEEKVYFVQAASFL